MLNNTFAQKKVDMAEMEYLSLLSRATSHFLNVELPEAEQDYNACLKLNSKSAVCYYQLSRIANIYNKIDNAIFFAKKSCELEKENTWYAVNLSNLLVKVKDYDGAEQALLKIINEDNYHLFAENLYEIYIAKNDFYSAIKVLQKKENRLGFAKDITFRIYENAEKINNHDLAEKSLKKLLLHYPDNFELYSRLFEVYRFQNRLEESQNIIEQMQNNYMNQAYINLIRGDIAFFKNDTLKVFEYYEKAFSSLDLPFDYKFKYLTDIKSFSIDYYDHPKMENLYKILMVNHSENAKLNAEYSLYLADKHIFDKAIERVEYAIKLDNSNFNYYHLLFNYLDYVCLYDKLNKATEDCMEYFPLNNEVILFHAISLIYQNNLSEAEDYISMVNKNTLQEFTSAVFCYANFLYFKKKLDFKKCKVYYLLTLENQASPSIVAKIMDNLLDIEVNSSQEEIIQSFIKLDSEDPFFYYLYAKYLFKNNNLKDAKYYIDKAKDKAKFFHVKLDDLYNQIYNN